MSAPYSQRVSNNSRSGTASTTKSQNTWRSDDEVRRQQSSLDKLTSSAVNFASRSKHIHLAFDQNAFDTLPRYDSSELELGHVIGRGGFCVVHELNGIYLADFNDSIRASLCDDAGEEGNSFRPGGSLKRKGRRKKRKPGNKIRSNGKYCVKIVAEDHIYGTAYERPDQKKYIKGVVDLINETKFLASLSHDNILKIRGLSTATITNNNIAPLIPNAGKNIAFAVIDKLHETFQSRLMRWMNKERRSKGLTGLVLGGVKRRKEKLLCDRLQAAYDIADVMSYLHSKDIIYRDLKPDNIGFDTNGNLKIFDFGLAKELRPENKVNGSDDLYNLTGLTGAIRYMAPEVGLLQPYNEKVDVYSWSILMWYILALEPPYGYFTQDMFVDRVFKRGVRPAIKIGWSKSLTSLMKRCWQCNISARPCFDEIKNIVRFDLIGMEKASNRSDTSQNTSPSTNSGVANSSCPVDKSSNSNSNSNSSGISNSLPNFQMGEI